MRGAPLYGSAAGAAAELLTPQHPLPDKLRCGLAVRRAAPSYLCACLHVALLSPTCPFSADIGHGTVCETTPEVLNFSQTPPVALVLVLTRGASDNSTNVCLHVAVSRSWRVDKFVKGGMGDRGFRDGF